MRTQEWLVSGEQTKLDKLRALVQLVESIHSIFKRLTHLEVSLKAGTLAAIALCHYWVLFNLVALRDGGGDRHWLTISENIK